MTKPTRPMDKDWLLEVVTDWLVGSDNHIRNALSIRELENDGLVTRRWDYSRPEPRMGFKITDHGLWHLANLDGFGRAIDRAEARRRWHRRNSSSFTLPRENTRVRPTTS